MGIFDFWRGVKPRYYTTPAGYKYKWYVDMLQQPHLLIAGATGSGKSVLINGLIYTALFDAPSQVQFILVDPKRVELVQYARLPHTLYHATEAEDRVKALERALEICDSRYKRMSKVRLRKYPGGHIYIIIDEYADLVTTQKKQVSPLIQRLAQIGRAANIHIILATQTPIAKVLSTEIKCNFDARVGLRTRSAQDSRNILGRVGCENLPRYGLGWYVSPDTDQQIAIPLYSEEELKARVNWWKNQRR